MTQSPVKSKVNIVFIPVNNLEQSAQWYQNILGIKGETHNEHLFIADMEGEAGVILDSMPLWRDAEGNLSVLEVPVIQFGTDDIEASYAFMKENEVELVTEIQHGHFL